MAETSRRDEILAIAAELMGSRGVVVTSVREIADAAGILSGSLYHHFTSKWGMVEEIITRYVDDLERSTRQVASRPGQAEARIRDLIQTSLEVSARHPHAAEIYQNDSEYVRGVPGYEHLREMSQAIRRCWLVVIEDGVKSGVFRPDIEPRTFYRFLRGSLWLSARWNRPTNGTSIDQLASDMVTVFVEGYAARPAAAEATSRAT